MLKKLLVLVSSVLISSIVISSVLVPSFFLVPDIVSAGGVDIWLSCCSSGCNYSPGEEVTFGVSTYCCTTGGWVAGSCGTCTSLDQTECQARPECCWASGPDPPSTAGCYGDGDWCCHDATCATGHEYCYHCPNDALDCWQCVDGSWIDRCLGGTVSYSSTCDNKYTDVTYGDNTCNGGICDSSCDCVATISAPQVSNAQARPDSYVDVGDTDDDITIYFTWDTSGTATSCYAELNDATPDESAGTDGQDTDAGVEGLNTYYVQCCNSAASPQCGNIDSDTITITTTPSPPTVSNAQARPDSYVDVGETDDDATIYFTWDITGTATSCYAEIGDTTPDENAGTDGQDTDTGVEGLNRYYVRCSNAAGYGNTASDTITISTATDCSGCDYCFSICNEFIKGYCGGGGDCDCFYEGCTANDICPCLGCDRRFTCCEVGDFCDCDEECPPGVECYGEGGNSPSEKALCVQSTTTCWCGGPLGEPDLKITDISVSGSEISYRIDNIGTGSTEYYSYSHLYVDSSYKAPDYVDALDAGAFRGESFSSYTWTCSGASDTIMVCADGTNRIIESDETNNCRTETLNCPITCSDTDGGNYPLTAGTCTDSTSHQDSCSGSELTEYYCSGTSCTTPVVPYDCNDYDCTTGLQSSCTGVGTSTLKRAGDDYMCADTNPDNCAITGSIVCPAYTYTCDLSKECLTQPCAGTNYKCHQSNAGAWTWNTLPLDEETACNDNRDNDCDVDIDCDDPDCELDPACIPPCELTNVLISPNCGGDCEQGETVSMSGSYTGDCDAADFFQIDAAGGGCDIQYSGGDMSGIFDTITVAGGSVSGTWTIPSITTACEDATVFATYSSLKDGGGSGSVVDDTWDVSGSFTFIPCTCGDWTNNVCGGGTCTGTQMRQTRTCTPAGCQAESRCVGPNWSGWIDQGCDVDCPATACALDEKCEIRTDSYGCAADQYRCSDEPACMPCAPGEICVDNLQCDGSCRREREVHRYNSICECVFDSYEYEDADPGTHCDTADPATWTTAGYCGSNAVYCSDDRYRERDRYECDGANNCNTFDYTSTLQDCGATSYSCPTTCTKRYTYTCSAGTCGTYTADYNCPIDTSCSAGSCSSTNPCSTGSYECADTCTRGQRQNRCDAGACNRFWQWVNTASCNPFSCSGGACLSVCEADCGADTACDGKTEGQSCGTGKQCDSSCNCVVVACAGYDTSAACNADANCAWCSGDSTCKDTTTVACKPPSCSGDSHSKCTSSCSWQDCGSTDSSCYCSAGSCMACSGTTPKCSSYQCVQCLADSDCSYCYQKCNTVEKTCYDFRSQLTDTCRYYDYCTSAACATDPAYCYNVDATLCADSSTRCHTWFSC